MPYIDKTGVHGGWALVSSPDMGLIDWVDEPPVQPVPVPAEVTRYQARVALLGAGLLDKVNAYFAALPSTDLGQLAWNEAPTVLRSNAALETAAESLGLTSSEVDQLFIAASQVQ